MATNKADITINAKFLRVDTLTIRIIWGVGWAWETSQNANVKLTLQQYSPAENVFHME